MTIVCQSSRAALGSSKARPRVAPRADASNQRSSSHDAHDRARTGIHVRSPAARRAVSNRNAISRASRLFGVTIEAPAAMASPSDECDMRRKRRRTRSDALNQVRATLADAVQRARLARSAREVKGTQMITPRLHGFVHPQRSRDLQPERLRGRHVNDELDVRRLLDREIGGSRAVEDFGDVDRRAP